MNGPAIEILRASTYQTVKVAIAASTTLSAAFDARPGAIYGLIVPSTFDGTSIGFTVSHDDVTYVDLYDSVGTIVAMPTAASRAYDLHSALAPWPYWKIKCATAQATTDTEFIVVGKG